MSLYLFYFPFFILFSFRAFHKHHTPPPFPAMETTEPPPEAQPGTAPVAPATSASAVPPRYANPFAVPEPIRRLFKRFPLHTTPENELPARCAVAAEQLPVLFVFASDEAARAGAPSHNPACLKWQVRFRPSPLLLLLLFFSPALINADPNPRQTYLKMAAIDFLLHPSNNHASPTGALPFLLTPSQTAIPSSKLSTYVATSAQPPAVPPRAETYLSLLDSALRPAYLHALYLDPRNSPLLTSLYLDPNLPRPVSAALAASLRSAAEEEILASTRRRSIHPHAIYQAASQALAALADALHASATPWFFGEDAPTLFDAAVFAYTNMLLDESLAWGDPRLSNSVREFDALVRHRERILAKYWPGLVRD